MGRHKKQPDANHMTPKQKAVFDYIKQCVIERNYPPSVRDICAAVGLKSTSSVFTYINDLETMGLIKKDPSHPRALMITTSEFRSAPEREVAQVPLVGTVAAGIPLLAQENVTDYFPIPVDMLPNKSVFMLTIKGESMINCGILNGDRVIVEQQETCNDGEIVVALVDDSATVKRFYKEDGHIRLQPENDSMDPIIVPDCKILGKVIGLIRMGMK
ncbi:MAG: transcriptional repressor LexA [Oribacterium sp.]|nr:transcriptional repressor LexA [Oribacterium sp.]MBO6307498.1 transcriptional repressor LexA [Oribacterium sp.]MBP3805621.1 transcriptional repressor LexA [Oribacterium sp.]MBR1857562.1 transcriptional repressor LexA [Oribacterium sp.]MCR5009220.1 transcriptional repressor LexA [Oribacterium sp.]